MWRFLFSLLKQNHHFAALKEEHGKQMSRMCVSFRNSQGDSERELLMKWRLAGFTHGSTVAWVTDPVKPSKPLWLESRAQRAA